MTTASSQSEHQPFHAGEKQVQQRLGVDERMAEVGARVIRDHMPEQHRRFLAQLPFILVASVDSLGRPWGSLLVGAPGFLQSSDPRTLHIAARPAHGDPLAKGLGVGAPLGFLAIELQTRRRNRVNGRLQSQDGSGLVIRVDQTVGNCPQYIQGRTPHFVRDPLDVQPRARDSFTSLDADARSQIADADTLFVATCAAGSTADTAGGADMSHRGGRAGFVHIEDDHTLLIPDFSGNNFFMTLGNIVSNPRAGLLFVDFARGDLLMLTGRAEIVWEGPASTGFAGAQRAWRFHLDSGVRLRDALPLRWSGPEYAPSTLETGNWQFAAAPVSTARAAQPWRTYRVARIVDESSVIRSFYLAPPDGQAAPAFEAGQYLPIRLPGAEGTQTHRTYTLSSAPDDPQLRLSIKRQGPSGPDAPPGQASNFLHDHIRVGSVIEARSPLGRFTIDAAQRHPAVLIAAGVGITPMVAFLRHIVAVGARTQYIRPVHLIQVAHDAASRAFGAELQALVDQSRGAFHLHLVLGNPEPEPHEASQSTKPALRGPLTMDMLKGLLPFDDHAFYLCGPARFMQAVYDGLRGLGVRDERIHAEAFGPASMQRRADPSPVQPATPVLAQPPEVASAEVRFAQTGVTATWTSAQGSLLDFAESQGLAPPFSCRAGHCGSCATRLIAGQVRYPTPTDWSCADGEVLLCSAMPAGDDNATVELDI